MSTAEPTAITFDEFGIAEKPPRSVRARRLLRQHPLGAFGLLLVVFVIFLAAFGPIIVPDSETISPDILLGPSGEHWFGTDRLGRDYLARVIAGARLSMSLALGAMAIGRRGGAGLGHAFGVCAKHVRPAVAARHRHDAGLPGSCPVALAHTGNRSGVAIRRPGNGDHLRGQHGPNCACQHARHPGGVVRGSGQIDWRVARTASSGGTCCPTWVHRC